MNRVVLSAVFACAGVFAQTVETIPFRAILSPANEVPAITGLDASGTATVLLHIVRDSSGRIVSGSADFKVNYRFPGEINITGLHIHRGEAGANGPVTIDSSLTRRDAQPAVATLNLQGQIAPDNAAAISTATDMLTNPAGFYVNMHTSANPGGAIRGQLMRAQQRVFMTEMNPGNEVPPITGLGATGLATVTLIFTSQPDGTLTSATYNFDINYTGFAADTFFTGFHIHSGAAGTNGPVTIDSGITGATAVASNGAGTLNYDIEVNMTNAGSVNTTYGVLADPRNYYLNLHTRVNPGGAIRGQLRRTDVMIFPHQLSPANEVPAVTGLDASASARTLIWTIRDDAGRVSGASVAFDVNYRFPGAVTFTGLHIHDGAAGANGPVTIDSRITASSGVISATGFGNIYRQFTVVSAAGLATINRILTDPASAYVNLHTQANPGGAVREQLSSGPFGLPSVEVTISGVSDPSFATVAPGGLISVYGRNLTRVGAGNSGSPGFNAPGSINGTQLVIADRAAALLNVSPRLVAAQIPFDVPAGMQRLYVLGPNGASNTVMVQVGGLAPGIFFDRIVSGGSAGSAPLPSTNVAAAYRLNDNAYVTEASPARAGDRILLFATGFGQTVPPLGTGSAAGEENNAQRPTVTVGGRTAAVMSSRATPNMVGLYQLVIQMPEGVAAGLAPLDVRFGEVRANSTSIYVR
ncbi:MAG: CHRD domain-containing protein [Bryobacteraceae bacterium]|nr:CHRD domain-containing protein [Bryobacteraceae bacterium]